MKPVDSRLPLSPRCAAAQESLNRFVQPGGSLDLSYSARIVEPRPVHGAGAILSHSRSPMALTYLRGHDRGSVSQPEIFWVSSATDRKRLSQTRPLGSSRSPHTDRYFSLSHILFRDGTEYPISQVMCCSSSSSPLRGRRRRRSSTALLAFHSFCSPISSRGTSWFSPNMVFFRQ